MSSSENKCTLGEDACFAGERCVKSSSGTELPIVILEIYKHA